MKTSTDSAGVKFQPRGGTSLEVPLSASIARQIETQILDGDLEPGDKLRQQQIGETLGVSRTPVREALLLLQARGLLTMTPNRGAVVRKMTRRDVAETYQVRAELEALAAALAAERVNPRDLRELTDLQQRLDESAETLLRNYGSGDESTINMSDARYAWIDTNDQFHEVILRISRCNRLVDTVKYVLSTLPRTLTWLANEQDRTVLNHYGDEHRRMIAALEAHDAEAARREAHSHVMHARELMLDWLDTRDDSLGR